MILFMLFTSQGFTAAAEELIWLDELPAEEHVHSYEYAYTQEPDCIEHGFSVYECTCGEHIEDEFTEPLGHNWGEPVVLQEATAEADGFALCVCERCGAEETEILPALALQNPDSGTEQIPAGTLVETETGNFIANEDVPAGTELAVYPYEAGAEFLQVICDTAAERFGVSSADVLASVYQIGLKTAEEEFLPTSADVTIRNQTALPFLYEGEEGLDYAGLKNIAVLYSEEDGSLAAEEAYADTEDGLITAVSFYIPYPGFYAVCYTLNLPSPADEVTSGTAEEETEKTVEESSEGPSVSEEINVENIAETVVHSEEAESEKSLEETPEKASEETAEETPTDTAEAFRAAILEETPEEILEGNPEKISEEVLKETPEGNVSENIIEEIQESEKQEANDSAILGEAAVSAGTVRVFAAGDAFPAGTMLSVSEASAEEPGMLFSTSSVAAFNSAPQDGLFFEDETLLPQAEEESIVYDKAIPDGEGGFLLVNPRSVDGVLSTTTEMVASYRYEISMIGPDGERLQPSEGQSVTLAFDLPEAEDASLDVRVMHYPETGGEEELSSYVKDGTVYAETTGFSAFVVEFRSIDNKFTVTGGYVTDVQTILEKLFPGQKEEEISTVISSDPETLQVIKEGERWLIEPTGMFEKTVKLTVRYYGGIEDDITANVLIGSKIPYMKEGRTETCEKYIPVSSLKDTTGVTLKDGWYVVDQDVNFSEHRLTVLGDVHLILMDGCTLNCNYGIRTATKVDGNTRLTIYGQDMKTGKLIANVAFESSEELKAGIGGNEDEDGGVVTVYGGIIDAKAYVAGAGIGGGHKGTLGSHIGNLRGFYMYDGEVTATGGLDAVGIGGGSRGNLDEKCVIYGGTLQAYASSEGGRLTGSKTRAAGIGGGDEMAQGSGVEIHGGTVYAEGYFGAGIGGGNRRDGGQVVVDGGTVVAVSLHGAGIGGGDGGNGGYVEIHDGTVVASGQDYKEDHQKIWLSMGNKQGNKYGTAALGMELLANWIAQLVMREDFGGAGIGGGDGGDGGEVHIYGGYLRTRRVHNALTLIA